MLALKKNWTRLETSEITSLGDVDKVEEEEAGVSPSCGPRRGVLSQASGTHQTPFLVDSPFIDD